jgi:G3E family GTPase
MRITPDTPIMQIKSAFTEKFPGLRIAFFKKSHEENEGSPKKDLILEDVNVADLNHRLVSTDIKWNKEMTVNEVEQYFEEVLGLHVQVFRLTGVNWLETTTTDKYTLEQQMKKSADSQHAVS